ncbi:MAG: hypothetical protein HUU55_16475 [Myxococcales bacterium]|nr:hypothetical protein [Myxococcales bacterium]
MKNPVSSVPSSAPIAWSPDGIELVCSRLTAMLKRLPVPLRAKVVLAMDEARRVAASELNESGQPSWLWRCYEASRGLERLTYEVTGCPDPGEEWATPDRIASIRIMKTVRIRFSVRLKLVDRMFARWDALGKRTEKSCDWVWERCNGGVRTDTSPIVTTPTAGLSYGSEYELIYGDVGGDSDES